MCSTIRDNIIHLTMLIGLYGLEWYSLKLIYKLYIFITTTNCTWFTRAFGGIHADITETEVCAGQVKILLYTSQCFLANIASNRCSLELMCRLYVCMIYVHYTTFSREFGDVHADINQTEVCAVQVDILMYTSQC